MKRIFLFIYRFLETYLKYGAMLLVMIIFTIFLFPLCRIFEKIIFPIWTITAKVYLYILGVRVKIVGQIPRGKNYVIVGNHTSLIDIFLIAVMARGQKGIVFLHEKLLKIPILGWWLRILNPIPINPKTKAGVLVGLRESVRRIDKEKIHFFGFPEGGRTKSGKMGEFKSGIFKIAINSESDIIPFGSAGAFEIKPKNRWWLKSGTIVVVIGKPISYNPKTTNDELSVLTEKRVAFCIKTAEELIALV